MRTKTFTASLILCVAAALATSSVQAAEYTIKFAHNMPPKDDAAYHLYFERFADLAKEYTNDAVALQEFPASQMGADQQAAKKLQLGSIEMMLVASNNLAQLYSGFNLFTLPFMFKNINCAITEVLPNDKIIAAVSEGAEQKANIRVLAFTFGGMRNMMNSQRPITSPSDLKGLRMRVAKNPIQLDTYDALGADAIGIASAETYGALQTKVVDGHDGGSAWAYSQKLHEVQNYLSYTGHQAVVNAIIINNDFYESLPPEVQEGLNRAAKEAAAENNEWMEGFEQEIYAKFEAAGLEANSPDLAPFQAAVTPVWEKYADRVGGKALVDQVQSLQEVCQ